MYSIIVIFSIILFLAYFKEARYYLASSIYPIAILYGLNLLYLLYLILFLKYELSLLFLLANLVDYIFLLFVFTIGVYFNSAKSEIKLSYFLPFERKIPIFVILLLGISIFVTFAYTFITGTGTLHIFNESGTVILPLIIELFIDAVSEEIIYRYFLISAILFFFPQKKKTLYIAFILSSGIWTFSHGLIDYMRFVQLFVLGMLWSFTFFKYGLSSSALVHFIHNLFIAVFISE